MSQPVLIALDWGTSNLRANLLDAKGHTLEARSAPGGVMAVPDRDFAGALLRLCGDWLEAHALPVIASGMVGSRQGWQEAPYLDCPADLASAARQCIQVELKTASGANRTVHIAAGLRCLHDDGAYDVMRGEETQIWGAGIPDGRCCVLPGTHSKWAWTGAQGQVVGLDVAAAPGELHRLQFRAECYIEIDGHVSFFPWTRLRCLLSPAQRLRQYRAPRGIRMSSRDRWCRRAPDRCAPSPVR
jgi:2-keto-3-deoxy-galactonokinase